MVKYQDVVIVSAKIKGQRMCPLIVRHEKNKETNKSCYGFSYKSSVPMFANRGRNFANGIGFVVCLYNHVFLLILSFATDFPNNHDWSSNFLKRGRNFANGIVFIACL